MPLKSFSSYFINTVFIPELIFIIVWPTGTSNLAPYENIVSFVQDAASIPQSGVGAQEGRTTHHAVGCDAKPLCEFVQCR